MKSTIFKIMTCCNNFKKAVDYSDIRYCRVENDKFNAVKKADWYIRSWAYDGPIASLEPFKTCPIELPLELLEKDGLFLL